MSTMRPSYHKDWTIGCQRNTYITSFFSFLMMNLIKMSPWLTVSFLHCFCDVFQNFFQSANELDISPDVKRERFSGWNAEPELACKHTSSEQMLDCLLFLVTWSHGGQRSGWGSPLFYRRAAVQHRLRIANQMYSFTIFTFTNFLWENTSAQLNLIEN